MNPANDPFVALNTPVPEIDQGAASLLLRDRYGLRAQLEPLSSERDLNYRVTTSDGEQFVLKFANLAEPVGVTDLQNRVLEHIAAADPDLPVPRVVPTSDGDGMFEVKAPTGARHTTRLLTWLDGVPLQRERGNIGIARDLGAGLARLDTALSDFTHPDSDYPLLWDIRNAGRLAELISYVDDTDLRAVCTARIERFNDKIEPRLQRLRSQVIYNDLNPGNVLVSADDAKRLAGVIDFGDVVHSQLVNDVAVAAAYQCEVGEDPFARAIEFVDAYNAILPLEEEEIVLLPDLILTRHLTTVMIPHWRAAIYPENRHYILRSESRARSMIETFSQRPLDQVIERFLVACGADSNLERTQ